MEGRGGANAAVAANARFKSLQTCSDDENFAVFGGASTSEPDTDELMDGRVEVGGRPPSSSIPVFHAGAAAARAGGVGTGVAGDDDDWLFNIQRPGDAAAAAEPPSGPPLQHPGCSGVAAFAMAGAVVATTTTTTTTTTRSAAAAAAVVGVATTSNNNTNIDGDIDDLLGDFKAARDREKQQAAAAATAAAAPSLHIERLSLASLGTKTTTTTAAAAASSSSGTVRFANTLQPLPAADEGPLIFSDGPAAYLGRAGGAGGARASAAAAPAAPPAPPPARPAPWAPARPLAPNRTAVVGPGASVAYEDEALTFSRSRRRPTAAAAAAASTPAAPAFRHPGM
jgi:hypothetical protein